MQTNVIRTVNPLEVAPFWASPRPGCYFRITFLNGHELKSNRKTRMGVYESIEKGLVSHSNNTSQTIKSQGVLGVKLFFRKLRPVRVMKGKSHNIGSNSSETTLFNQRWSVHKSTYMEEKTSIEPGCWQVSMEWEMASKDLLFKVLQQWFINNKCRINVIGCHVWVVMLPVMLFNV